MGKIRSTANEQPVQQAYAIDPKVDARLGNWAAWLRGRHDGGRASSMQWRYAARGTRAAAYPDGARSAVVITDVADARQVEQLVCALDYSALLRAVLKAHWVVQAHPRATCTALGLHPLAYEQWVHKAACYFATRWSEQHRD